jgi:hypothetical protein
MSSTTIAAIASAHSQAAVAIRLAATGLETTAQYAIASPNRMPATAYPATMVWGEKVSDRTAALAGIAISATVTTAPTAAAAASAKRHGPPGRVETEGSERRREAITAPKTVALAVIHVAQPRLLSQVVSSTVSVTGQITTPRP